MYHSGFAGLDHGWLRLKMYNEGASPIPGEAPLVYYLGFAGLDHRWLRLEMYNQRGLAHA